MPCGHRWPPRLPRQTNCGGPFDTEVIARQIAALEAEAAGPAFWNDPETARTKMARLQALRAPVSRIRAAAAAVSELQAVLELAELAPTDADLAAEAQRLLPALEKDLGLLEMEVLLAGPYDRGDAIVAIHPGAGGTESQDWAEMLLRMYLRWAEAHGYTTEIIERLEGEEAGIKSATFSVRGPNAYGLLGAEKGVHRLVRMSPFDASGRRHTSFASVEVLPELPEDAIEIRPEDLEIDRFRASGAGGQHINRTESAIRLTHRPSGLVVTCQDRRSQHSNLEAAMVVLRARLGERALRAREREVEALRGPQKDIAFGSQIRSYVFAPYQLVKDHRTNAEASDIAAVMDGALDPFIAAYLGDRHERATEAATRTR